MPDYSLIKQLDNPVHPKDTTPNIDYQQYELVVEGNDQKINIPKRESEVFETTIAKLTKPIDRTKLQQLLREFRGTRAY